MEHVCGCGSCVNDFIVAVDDQVASGAAVKELEEVRKLLCKMLPGRPNQWRKLDIVEGIKALAEGRWL